MKKILFAAVALFIMNGAFAQINIGVKAGANLTDLTDIKDSKMKVGFHVGAFAEFVINERISIQPELLFSTQGATSSYKEEGITIDETLNLDYINVPILLKVNIAGGLSAEIGPQVGFLLSAKAKEEAMGNSVSMDIKDQCKTLDVSLPIGLSYTFSEKFVVGARYAFGLTKWVKDDDSNSKSKNSVIQVSFGYKF